MYIDIWTMQLIILYIWDCTAFFVEEAVSLIAVPGKLG